MCEQVVAPQRLKINGFLTCFFTSQAPFEKFQKMLTFSLYYYYNTKLHFFRMLTHYGIGTDNNYVYESIKMLLLLLLLLTNLWVPFPTPQQMIKIKRGLMTTKTRRWGHVSWEYLEGSKDDPKNAQIEHSRRPQSTSMEYYGVPPSFLSVENLLYTILYNRKMKE